MSACRSVASVVQAEKLDLGPRLDQTCREPAGGILMQRWMQRGRDYTQTPAHSLYEDHSTLVLFIQSTSLEEMNSIRVGQPLEVLT